MKMGQIIALLAMVTVVMAVFAAGTAQPREPVYGGKRLSQWLDEYQRGIPKPEYKGDPQMCARAEEAVRKIGTNAMPWLLQELSAKEATQGGELPTNFTSGEAIGRRWLAATAFNILGPSAKNATPTLIRLLEDKQTSYIATSALGGIGVESIPVLTQALTNTNACARESAARVLGMFGKEAQSAIPALICCARDKDDSVRGFATFSLGQIGQEPDIGVPVLIANLRDADHSTRWNAACALAKFGDRAKSAFPALLKVVREDHSDLRETVTEALHQIDPKAAAKAVTK
jgi:hypothetical protein